jgi:ATP/ADP translocase
VLAVHALSTEQASRLCGVVGAGAVLGWIGGGLVTEAVALGLGTPSLLLASAAMTALCPILARALWPSVDREARGDADAMVAGGGLRQSALDIWRSPHLRAIACLAFVSAAVSTLVGLEFKVFASQAFVSRDGLAAFFGVFSFRAGLVALATQLLFTSWIVCDLGLGAALVVAPLALSAGSVGVLVSGTLAAAALLKGSDQVLRHSVDRAAMELLYRPLSEREVFERKVFIDALVCRCGDALGGVIASVGTGRWGFGAGWMSVASLALLVVWLFSARVAHVRYEERLRRRGSFAPVSPDVYPSVLECPGVSA